MVWMVFHFLLLGCQKIDVESIGMPGLVVHILQLKTNCTDPKGPRLQQFRSRPKSLNLNCFWRKDKLWAEQSRQAGWLVGWTKQWNMWAASSHISATISQARPQHQAAHRGVGQTLQAIHNNGTLRARPCRTKKPGIQLMRLNAGRAGGVLESFSWSTILVPASLPECTVLPFSGNARLCSCF